MGKGQRKRTERRAEQEGGGEEARPVVAAPEPSEAVETESSTDDEPEFSTSSNLLIADPEGCFKAASEAIGTALDYGENALDLVDSGDSADRVRSAAEMQFAQLQAQIALVNAVRDIGIGLRYLDQRMSDLEHQVRFRQDPPQPHTHQLHLS